MAEEAGKTALKGRQGGVAGRVEWLAWSGGRLGRVGGQVVGGGWTLGVRNVLE